MSNHSVLSQSPSGLPVFYRTYSRIIEGKRESYDDVVSRNLRGLARIGKLTEEEILLIMNNQTMLRALPSGRWLWVGGTDWLDKPENWSGAFNCTSTEIVNFNSLADLMELAMMGSGTGAVIEEKNVANLPPITSKLNIEITGLPGDGDMGKESTKVSMVNPETYKVKVGDSRKGWVNAYLSLLILASMNKTDKTVMVDMSAVRPKGSPLKGFGGIANPSKLPELFPRVAKILNKAASRESNNRLTALEICLIIDEAASVVVAGNIRRSAGMRQFSKNDVVAANSKANLWVKEGDHWIIDPERDALRMANHTMVYHTFPSYADIHASVKSQFVSGEGAIQFAPEAIARSNGDILVDLESKKTFIEKYTSSIDSAKSYLSSKAGYEMTEEELQHRMLRYGLNPCFAPGTMVMTREGHFPIESLVGKEVEVFDGKKWVAINNFRVTGTDQQIYEVQLHSGLTLEVTPMHSFILKGGKRVPAWQLSKGMELESTPKRVNGTISAKGAYLKGFLIGDGTHDKNARVPICKVYEPKKVCVERLVGSQQEIGVVACISANGRPVGHEFGLTEAGYLKNLNTSIQEDLLPWCSVYKHEFPVEVYNWTEECQFEFIAGLFDADGCLMDTKKGFGYQITSVSRKFLEGLGILLTQLDIRWKIGPVRKGGTKDWGGRGGICNAQDTYRITIPQSGSIKLARLTNFERLASAANKTVAYSTKDNSFKVVSVKPTYIAPTVYCCTVPESHSFTLSSAIVIGQCGEIVGSDFHCNLAEVHLNNLANCSEAEIDEAFKAAAISACCLLHRNFVNPVYKYSRDIDPIVAVSFTGLFDFFVHKFGLEWLKWWEEGRPNKPEMSGPETTYLARWKSVVEATVSEYCNRHGLKVPNRSTTVQPAGTKSLLSGASSGWHPPKAQRFIRRITFGKNDPVALACIGAGYSVVPSQSDKDEEGKLLQDPFDERCTEWLVEIPTEVSWANIPGVDKIDINQFSAAAQFDFYMQVQKYYTTHNTSATIEFRESEISALTQKIYESIGNGYVSAALLARFDSGDSFPRLPFEPITKEKYDEEVAKVAERKIGEFEDILNSIVQEETPEQEGPAACDSDKCLIPSASPE
jgi:ribonucleotide reductase, class II